MSFGHRGTATGPPTARPRPIDYGRDLLALLFIAFALTAPWSYGDRGYYDDDGAVTGGEVTYVLLPLICSILSLLPTHLVGVTTGSDGAATRWQPHVLRVWMNVPVAVVVAVTVVRDITKDHTGLGLSLSFAIFGATLAAVPRSHELRDRPDAGRIAGYWRTLGAWAGLAGGASIILTFFVTLPSGIWDVPAALWRVLVPFLAVLLLAILVLSVPTLRVAQGRTAWQPALFTLMASVLFLVQISSDGDYFTSIETVHDGVYGLWLLVLGAAVAAVPVAGGVDGSPDQPRFWRLVAAHAFELVLIGGVMVLVVLLPTITTAGRYGVKVPGELIWLFISAVLTVVLTWAGAYQLRADPISGPRVALGMVTGVVVLRIIDFSVVGIGALQSSTFLVALIFFFGVYLLIFLALLAPEPVRRERAERLGFARAPGPGDHVGPTALVGGEQDRPYHQAAAPHRSGGLPVVGTEPDRPTATMTTAGGPTELDHTRVVRPNVPGAVPMVDHERRAAADPATPGTLLMELAGGRPDLRVLIAENPSTYPDLLDWLETLGDADVARALARRRSGGFG
ncbi:hypothetical protein D1871_07180 [Nakamurella silvestris]|nr:hypothetical protein D1871_07180 [Nakamurella silvestris]